MFVSQVTYHTNYPLDTLDIIKLYRSSGLKRPIDDKDRITEMFLHANLVTRAWDGDKLVGVARSLTDFSYCCYLSDLAIRKDYQKHGIGKQLINLTQKAIGERSMLLLLSAPSAMGYYPKIGFGRVENGFIQKRKL